MCIRDRHTPIHTYKVRGNEGWVNSWLPIAQRDITAPLLETVLTTRGLSQREINLQILE